MIRHARCSLEPPWPAAEKNLMQQSTIAGRIATLNDHQAQVLRLDSHAREQLVLVVMTGHDGSQAILIFERAGTNPANTRLPSGGRGSRKASALAQFFNPGNSSEAWAIRPDRPEHQGERA